MDTPSIFEQPTPAPVSQPATAPQPATKSRAASTRKAATAVTPSGLHPLQAKAIRFIGFNQDNVPAHQTVEQYGTQFTNEFLTEAIARHLGWAQRQGEELPPKMLSKLVELQLVK